MRRLACLLLLVAACAQASAPAPSPPAAAAPASASSTPAAAPSASSAAAGARVVEVDPTASYRVAFGMLEAGACGSAPCEVRLSGKPDLHAQVTLSGGSQSAAAFASSPLGLAAFVVADGISLKAKGGNIAPGCNDTGAGLTIPRHDGAYDFAALRACARHVKGAAPAFASEHAVRIGASPDVPFIDVLSAIEALRGDKGELLPDVTLERGWPVAHK